MIKGLFWVWDLPSESFLGEGKFVKYFLGGLIKIGIVGGIQNSLKICGGTHVSPEPLFQWWIQGRALGPPLFLDQTEARRAEDSFFGDQLPPPLI